MGSEVFSHEVEVKSTFILSIKLKSFKKFKNVQYFYLTNLLTVATPAFFFSQPITLLANS